MTIELDGITPEQYKVPVEKVVFDLEKLNPGEGAWADTEALWADTDGYVFLDTSYPQVPEEYVDVIHEDGSPGTYMYVLNTPGGLLVTVAHLEDYKIPGNSRPSPELRRDSVPVSGVVWEEGALDWVNDVLLVELECKLKKISPRY